MAASKTLTTAERLADAMEEIGVTRIPTTVAEFADTCRAFADSVDGRDKIYTLFEDVISVKLRVHICPTHKANSPEPRRAALRAIGIQYDIACLINY